MIVSLTYFLFQFFVFKFNFIIYIFELKEKKVLFPTFHTLLTPLLTPY